MINELFSIVDMDDSVMYNVSGKNTLHRIKKFHRSVHVMIEVVNNVFLLQQKAAGSENEGKWSTAVSGHVRTKESYVDAAIRETKEELGLTVKESDLLQIGKHSPCEETGYEFVMLYSYRLNPNVTKLKVYEKEVSGIYIGPLADVVKRTYENKSMYSPAFIVLFDWYLMLHKDIGRNKSEVRYGGQ